MENKNPVGGIEKIVINCLAALGGILYIGLQCNPYLPLSGPDQLIKNLALSLTILVQTVRGLVTLLLPQAVPAWLAIKKLDRRFGADTTVVFLLLAITLELTIRGSLDPAAELLPPYIGWPLVALQLGLGGWLLVESTRRSAGNVGPAIAGIFIFTLIFLSPFLAAGGIAFAMYKFMDIHTEREYHALSVAIIMPMLIACLILRLRDKRDRAKNTFRVIINQFIALPAVPVIYLLLKNYWPEQINPLVLPLALLVGLTLPTYAARRTRPWLVKERVEILIASCASDKQLLVTPSAEMEAELQAIRVDLGEKRLVLKNASDFMDRADAFWKLGDLDTNLSRYDVAEEDYKAAIDNFNRVLAMDSNNGTAIAHKFKTVEALSTAQALRSQDEKQQAS